MFIEVNPCQFKIFASTFLKISSLNDLPSNLTSNDDPSVCLPQLMEDYITLLLYCITIHNLPWENYLKSHVIFRLPQLKTQAYTLAQIFFFTFISKGKPTRNSNFYLNQESCPTDRTFVRTLSTQKH